MADYTLGYTGAQIDDLLGKAGNAAPKNTVYTRAEVDSKLSDKVDAVSGKGLSSNDFTNEEKAKLADLENYDDTDIRTAINSTTQSVSDLSSEIAEARGTYSSLDERLDDMGSGGEQVQSDWNETDSTVPAFIRNKPNIPAGVVVDLVYDPTSENAQAGVAVADAVSGKVDKVNGKGLSTNDFTDADKDKLDGIAANAEANVQSDWNQNDSTADDFIKNKPTIAPANDAILEIQKNGIKIGEFTANASVNSIVNITVPVDADDVSALPDTTKYGAALSLSIDSSTYVVTATLIDQDGETLGTAQTIDLPLESVVVNGSYDATTRKIVLTLNNGNTIEFSVADLVSGLQTEITSTNKLSADLVDDSTSTNKFVTAADKTSWNAKSDFSGSYDDLTDVPEFATVATSGSYNDLTDKPVIPPGAAVDQTYDPTSQNAQSGVAVAGAIVDKVDKVNGKGLSTNDFTDAYKNKLDGVESGAEANVQPDWNQNDISADDFIKNKPTFATVATSGSYADLVNKPTIPTVNNATLEIQKNGVKVGEFTADASSDTTVNITVPVDANDVNALPDTTKYASSIVASIDNTTYVMTVTLKDQDGNALGTAQTIDLPLETVVVGGSYDDTTKKVILTLKNGTTVDFSVADLVAGLQTEITSTNKLDADLVDDTTSVHKFVTTAEKEVWNAKSDFSGSYNDLTNKPTIPTVDQTYGSTSANAQSGVAVAQAIAKKPGLITTGRQYYIDGQFVTAGNKAEAFNDSAYNKAIGGYSHAEGSNTTSSGQYSHAEGYDTTSAGDYSHAEGEHTVASEAHSHAEGLYTTASGVSSHAEGEHTVASGHESHAEGEYTVASGRYSHAEGYYTTASSSYQHVQGTYNVEDANSTYAFIIGNGSADNARHNAFAIGWNGLIYVNGATTGVDVAALAATIGDINTVLEEVL